MTIRNLHLVVAARHSAETTRPLASKIEYVFPIHLGRFKGGQIYIYVAYENDVIAKKAKVLKSESKTSIRERDAVQLWLPKASIIMGFDSRSIAANAAQPSMYHVLAPTNSSDVLFACLS